ncbi:MAG: hypothetical protein HW406_2964 [Candidatus Brocadiaceae bacterium]|nr:hypothetical protein [Candidatus Brocadiaceae bacterium]
MHNTKYRASCIVHLKLGSFITVNLRLKIFNAAEITYFLKQLLLSKLTEIKVNIVLYDC